MTLKSVSSLVLIYDIYLLQLGFHQVAVIGRFVQKWERELYTKGETVQKTIQKYRVNKILKKNNIIQ